MIGLLLGAFRARRAQTVTVLLLAMVAAAAAVAAPWYVLAAAETAAVSDVTGAPNHDRTFTAARDVVIGAETPAAPALAELGAAMRQALPVPGSRQFLGLIQIGADARPGSKVDTPVAYRDELCGQVAITGRCPAARGEALITPRTAELFGVSIGGRIDLHPGSSPTTLVALRVVGTYQITDPDGEYWSGSQFGPAANDSYGPQRADTIFVPLSEFDLGGFLGPVAVGELVLPPVAFRRTDALASSLAQARYTLTQSDLRVSTSAPDVIALIHRDRQLIEVGVPIGAAQLLVLTWFALYLAGRYTVQDRRSDVALLKLRGAGRGRLLRLVAGQSAVPILAGLVLGSGLGYLVARLVGGEIQDAGWRRLAGQLSVAAVGVAVLGALLTSMLAEWRTLRAPVVDLLRRVPARRRTWRTDAVDLSVVALAIASAYQIRSQHGVLDEVPGLAVLAPGLFELAIALLLARLLTYAAGRVGGWALHHGRTRLALGILQVVRRPGADRVFALLTVAVAMLGTAAMRWDAARSARDTRAAAELGAQRVLTVQAANRTQLLAAVRAADPGGGQAMAAVVNTSAINGSVGTLAVDVARLDRVARWPSGVGQRIPQLLAPLAAGIPAPVTVSGSRFEVDASVSGAGGAALWLTADLEDPASGARSTVRFGPLGADRRTYSAATGCTTERPCRLVDLALSGPAGATTPSPAPSPRTPSPAQSSAQSPAPSPAPNPVVPSGADEGPDAQLDVPPSPPPYPPEATVTVDRLAQRGPDRTVLSGADLADPRRFRTGVGVQASTLSVSGGDGQLRLAVDATQAGHGDQRAFVRDGPVPLPAILAGTVPDWALGDPRFAPFGGDQVPVRVVGTAPVLPGLGDHGVLVDLESTQRVVTGAGIGDVMQVWLAPGAPAGVLDRLRSAGLRILDDRSAGAFRDRLDRQGTAAALRFQLLTALVGILLATAALSVAGAVERGPRAADLRALRAQGLPAAAATACGYGGYAALVALGILAGTVAAAFASVAIAADLPVFSDGWHLLPSGTGLRPYPLGLVAVAVAVPLGLAAFVVGRLLLRLVGRAEAGR